MKKGLARACLTAATCLLTLSAHAKPITLLEMRHEYQKRGYERIDVAYRNGHPVLTASIFGQSFDAVLRECEGIEYACEAVRFTTCFAFPEQADADPYLVANAYNRGVRPGASYVPDESETTKVCLRMHQRFSGADSFGHDEIYAWQNTLENFLLDVETEIRLRTDANVSASN